MLLLLFIVIIIIINHYYYYFFFLLSPFSLSLSLSLVFSFLFFFFLSFPFPPRNSAIIGDHPRCALLPRLFGLSSIYRAFRGGACFKSNPPVLPVVVESTVRGGLETRGWLQLPGSRREGGGGGERGVMLLKRAVQCSRCYLSLSLARVRSSFALSFARSIFHVCIYVFIYIYIYIYII